MTQSGPFPKKAGKKKACTTCSSAELFFAEKWGAQRKDFGGRYGFPGFYRVFISTTSLESFSLKPEKFSRRFSCGGGSVRSFLLCFCGKPPGLPSLEFSEKNLVSQERVSSFPERGAPGKSGEPPEIWGGKFRAQNPGEPLAWCEVPQLEIFQGSRRGTSWQVQGTSREVRGLPEARGSLIPSLRLAKFVSKKFVEQVT